MKPTDILILNYSLFKKMKDLAEKQESLISEEQMEEFNILLDQREQIRTEITANMRKYHDETKRTPFKNRDQEVNKITMQMEDIIRSIQDTDKRIEGLIISKKDAFQDEIKNIRRGKTAIRSYRGARQKINRFMDRKG
ncbi:MAG: flagellar protein FliT [Deltaproteobacteria bacterium]|nr:flagellar protein FliT [Deltaproteobacteria bacterium]